MNPTRWIPSPLQRAGFRQVWAGMTVSTAGDRVQQLAQGWLIATLTNSGLAVGFVSILAALPLLFLPLGGGIAERWNRRNLLIGGQLAGAFGTLLVTALVLTGQIAVWQLYLWIVVNGCIVLVSRPAYKVILTEAVPRDEINAAVALNTVSEQLVQISVNGGGSMVLALLGLPVAFLLNLLSYIVAALCLLRVSAGTTTQPRRTEQPTSLLADVAEGIRYLATQPLLHRPLLLTFGMGFLVGPVLYLMPALVHAHGGTILELGMFAAAISASGIIGATFAGTHNEGAHPVRTYLLLNIVSAGGLLLFTQVFPSPIALALIALLGFAGVAEAVWNTGRVRKLAGNAYQARLQAITSMVITLSVASGMLWAGSAVDHFGIVGLAGGAGLLLAGSLIAAALSSGTLLKSILLLRRRSRTMQE